MGATMAIERFEQLEVWQKAHDLVLHVYRVTAHYPAEEKFGLISQMRRAAVAVPANIAEGFKRRGRPDKARFYNIAQASLEELRYYFILSRDLKFSGDHENLISETGPIARMLTALIRTVTSETTSD
jgi:four helix bundle protein